MGEGAGDRQGSPGKKGEEEDNQEVVRKTNEMHEMSRVCVNVTCRSESNMEILPYYSQILSITLFRLSKSQEK